MTLTADGRTVEARGTLLDALLAAGIALPHLCKDGNLPAIGACRTCMVEADGRMVAACTTPAAGVAVVSAWGERAVRIRRGVLALTAGMLDGGEAGVGGPCAHELAEALAAHGVPLLAKPLRARPGVDRSSPFFSFYEGECILCGRCVLACRGLQHIGAIGLAGRGRDVRVTPGTGTTFLASECTACGSCVAACPTTALRPVPQP